MKKEFWLKNAHHSKTSTSDIYSRTREKKSECIRLKRWLERLLELHYTEKLLTEIIFVLIIPTWIEKKAKETDRKKHCFFALIFRLAVVFVFLVRVFFHATIHLQFYSNFHLICRSHTKSNSVVYWQTVSNYKLLMRVKCNLIRCWINESDVLLIHRRIKTK